MNWAEPVTPPSATATPGTARIAGSIDSEMGLRTAPAAAFSSNAAAGAVRKPISESMLPAILAVPGVAVAEGGVTGSAQFIAANGKAVTTGGAPMIGMSYSADQRCTTFRSSG